MVRLDASKFEHNRETFLRICVYLVRFVSEHLGSESGLDQGDWMCVVSLVRLLVRQIGGCGAMAYKCWQFVFKNDLLKRLPFQITSEFVYEGKISVF